MDSNVVLIPELLPHICVLWREIALAPDKQQAWRVGSDPGEPEPVLSPGSPGVVEVGLQFLPPRARFREAVPVVLEQGLLEVAVADPPA